MEIFEVLKYPICYSAYSALLDAICLLETIQFPLDALKR